MYDWKKVEEWVRASCTVDEKTGHWVWKNTSLKINSPVNLPRFALPRTRNRYRLPMCWLAMARRKHDFMEDGGHSHRVVRSCDVENCVTHHFVLQRRVTCISEFDVDDHEDACSRFDACCKPKDEKTGCIGWKGFITRQGYGKMRFCGDSRRAHAVALELATGKPVPHGMLVLHTCGSKSCVNIDHLKIGTFQDKVSHLLLAGKFARGEKAGKSKITDKMAKQIIDSLEDGTSSVERAGRFKVDVCTVRGIDRGRSWTHLMSAEEAKRRQETPRRSMPKVKLSRQQVSELKRLKGEKTVKERAEQFGVPTNYVYQVDLGIARQSVKADEAEDIVAQGKEAESKLKTGFERTQKTIEERCERWVDEEGKEHLLWDGRKDTEEPELRPTISFLGDHVSVARASWMIHHRLTSLPKDKPFVLHACKRKFCVLPAHLYPGTAERNSRDMFRDQTVQSKLTEAQVREILALKGSCLLREAAKKFDVTISCIHSIWSGETWRHLDDKNAENEEDAATAEEDTKPEPCSSVFADSDEEPDGRDIKPSPRK